VPLVVLRCVVFTIIFIWWWCDEECSKENSVGELGVLFLIEFSLAIFRDFENIGESSSVSSRAYDHQQC
jgi:hypothetical protein